MATERSSFFFGATLSEVGFILFFALLLFAFFQRQVDIDAIREAEATAETLAVEIAAREAALSELENIQSFATEEEWAEYFSELVPRAELTDRNQALLAENQHLQDRLNAFSELQEQLKRSSESGSSAAKEIREAIRLKEELEKAFGSDTNVTPERMADALEIQRAIEEFNQETQSPISSAEELREALARQRDLQGQVINLQDRIARAGGGRDLPPCWSSSLTGKVEFLFDIVITDNGLHFSSAAPEYRQREYARLPNTDKLTQGSISLEAFTILARPILDWSDERKCRHYVAITDSSENSYKATLTIEDYFYKFVNRT